MFFLKKFKKDVNNLSEPIEMPIDSFIIIIIIIIIIVIIIIIIVVVVVIELKHSKTILENTVEIEP